MPAQVFLAGLRGDLFEDCVAKIQTSMRVRLLAQGLLQHLGYELGVTARQLFLVDFSENRPEFRMSVQSVAQEFIKKGIVEAWRWMSHQTFLFLREMYVSMTGMSASAQSNVGSWLGISQTISACSWRMISPFSIVQINGRSVIVNVGYLCVQAGKLLAMRILIAISSWISRCRHSSGNSPGSIFPPGNSHLPGILMYALRCVARTNPSRSMMAHVTVICFRTVEKLFSIWLFQYDELKFVRSVLVVLSKFRAQPWVWIGLLRKILGAVLSRA